MSCTAGCAPARAARAAAADAEGRRRRVRFPPISGGARVNPPPLPWLAPRSLHTHAHRSAALPTCSGDADLGQRGQQGCGPRRRRVRRAVRPRVRRARRQQMPKGGRRAVFFLHVQRLTTPPVCACCVGRGRGSGGGSGSGPSTISTRALVSAGGAANGGGAGGGAPCALRLFLIPPGAPRGSQNKKNMILEGRRAGTRVGPWGFGVRG